MGTIRKARQKDLDAVNNLLGQVLAIHNAGRPDLFRPTGKKYTDEELLAIFDNPETPVFVYEEAGMVLGYAFCAFNHQSSGSLQPLTSLYLDDLCVDEKARGKHIGNRLFDFVKNFAKENGCHNLTLHAWECNPGAVAFYKAMGMDIQYYSMELLLDRI